MKIVQINTVYGTGSTGKIMAALYHLAETEGFTSYVAYGRGNFPSQTTEYKIGNPIDFLRHVLKNFIFGKSGFGSKSVTKRFLKWLDDIQPDILHLHNLHGFYLHVGLFFEYIKSRQIPIIWTFHDCWPITGQCAHFDYAGCNKWKIMCHNCPIYRTNYPYSLFKDNSRQNYCLKKEAFSNVPNMTIVTPSNWLANIVKNSFLRSYPVRVIPNGIDLDLFKPASFSFNKKIILGVANVWSRSKGLAYFLQLARMLDASYHIVLIGLTPQQCRSIHASHGNQISCLTRTSSQSDLISWYQCAYVYVNPTLEDTFPTTNLEALACGTPVITFRTGGSPESITDKCGIVVEKGNIEQLKEAILSLEHRTDITSHSCREQAMNYDVNKNFHDYINLYKSVYHSRIKTL